MSTAIDPKHCYSGQKIGDNSNETLENSLETGVAVSKKNYGRPRITLVDNF